MLVFLHINGSCASVNRLSWYTNQLLSILQGPMRTYIDLNYWPVVVFVIGGISLAMSFGRSDFWFLVLRTCEGHCNKIVLIN